MAEPIVPDTPDVSTPPAAEPAVAAPSALDAVRSAADRLSKADPSPAAPADGPPAAGTVTPPIAEPEGIRNLRTAYEALKGKVGWADGLTESEVRDALSLLSDLRKDPATFYKQLGTDLTAHPDFKARMAPPAAEETEPPPDLFTTDERGNRIEMYSAGQQRKWRDWNEKRVTGQLRQEIAPLQEWRDSAREAEERRAIIDNAKATTVEVMAEMRKLPHFTKENEAKISVKLAAIPVEFKRKFGAVASLQRAYHEFMRDDILPTIDKAAQDRIREEFARKANAGGSVKPGSGQSTSAKKSPSNPSELAAHLRMLSERSTTSQ